LPLFTPTKLAQPEFPVPISIVLGEHDWVVKQLKDTGENMVMLSKMTHDNQARCWVCPDAGHNMHLDNPHALANILLHEIMGDKYCRENRLPILTAKEYADYHFKLELGDNIDVLISETPAENLQEELIRLMKSNELLKTRYKSWQRIHDPKIVNINVEEFYQNFWADEAPLGIPKF
jgi:hypothetical protein